MICQNQSLKQILLPHYQIAGNKNIGRMDTQKVEEVVAKRLEDRKKIAK